MTIWDQTEKVLLIDDDPDIHDLVDFHLADRVGYLMGALNARAGGVLASQEKPDLILLDIRMPDEDGLSLCRKLQADVSTRDIPVIFLTGCDEPDQLVEAFEAGAVDYIRKPICRTELIARVGARLSAKNKLNHAREQARLDGLTGLGNRIALDECLAERVAEHQEESFPFSLAILDLDYFKTINDGYGHQMGDEIICAAVRAFVRMSRPYDRLFRFGGDEFVVVVPGGEPEDAEVVVSRMLDAVSGIRLPVQDGQVSVTCSGGLISQSERSPSLSAKALLERADKALYEAKRTGRNRLVIGSAD
ncbi:MAG: diguanylate cyclase response regulator [Deltaproteobacteria bacterium]|nr:diguanylate cyclase response regulator [Deltaproteobacteria bacterium]